MLVLLIHENGDAELFERIKDPNGIKYVAAPPGLVEIVDLRPQRKPSLLRRLASRGAKVAMVVIAIIGRLRGALS